MSCDAKTAESPCQTKLTISDIDAEELFEDFNKIVVISQYEGQMEAPHAYRKLEFEESIKNKLNFDQKTASMKRKRKAGFEETLSIKPFKILENQNPDQPETSSPCTPAIKIKTKPGSLSTPKKKITKSAELEKAAKKKDPFRDLKEIN